MSIAITSTTDTQSNVKAAMAEPKESKPKVEASASAPEANASEQNEAPESDTEATETQEEKTEASGESDGEGAAEETDPAAADDKSGKKKGGFQRRIDKLNSRVTAKEQELNYWKELALKNAGAPKTESKADPKPTASEGKPTPDDFDKHQDYIEALTEWKTDQKLKERDQQAAKASLETEQAKLNQAHSERVKAFAATVDDFQEALEGVDDVPVSPVLRELILTSENGPQITYELAKNRDEFIRVNQLSPLALARELGRIESRLVKAPSTSTSENKKKTTSAPNPLKPVSGGKSGVTKDIYDPALSQSDYEAIRAKQRKATG